MNIGSKGDNSFSGCILFSVDLGYREYWNKIFIFELMGVRLLFMKSKYACRYDLVEKKEEKLKIISIVYMNIGS